MCSVVVLCSKWCRRLQRVSVFCSVSLTFCLVWSIIRPFFGLELFFFQNPKLKKVQILSQKKRKREENDHHHKAHTHSESTNPFRTDGRRGARRAEFCALLVFVGVGVLIVVVVEYKDVRTPSVALHHHHHHVDQFRRQSPSRNSRTRIGRFVLQIRANNTHKNPKM